uniref:Uncharacterized protein n=1 Tax=Rhizophagus irregularis (strain DAOM 181602 / DAOM 197198 / MUCL 43194) TaxID=747089 RepID=U9TWZ3_RHIID
MYNILSIEIGLNAIAVVITVAVAVALEEVLVELLINIHFMKQKLFTFCVETRAKKSNYLDGMMEILLLIQAKFIVPT